MTSPPAGLRAATIRINGASHQTEAGERLVDAINRAGLGLP